MKTSSKIGLAAAAGMVALGGASLAFLGRGPEPSPEVLIAESLRDAEQGAKHRNPSEVIEVVSDNFQAGMWNKKRLYLYLVRSMRQGRGTDYDVRVNVPRILPANPKKPDQRVVITKMSAFYANSGEDIWGSGLMTLVMRKESRPRWLVFREPRWRIVSVANVPPLPLGGDSGE